VAATKAGATKVAATKAGATKVAATKSVVTKAGATKVAGTKAGATKVAATKAGAAKVGTKAGATKAAATKSVVTKTTTKAGATKVAATKATGTPPRAASPEAGAHKAGARPQRLQVRENEKPWTVKELGEVRAELEADVVRLQKEISVAEYDLAGLMRDVGDGAGDDPADAGTATFEREQEISLANNAREVFEQSARALARLVGGTYGICESCGSPIGKNRLLAFPRATLCLTCKSKQERR
jgi:RNA polymerase-binding transcription factor DksA